MKILSGLQPSGTPHLGNYFGAIKQHLEMQGEGSAYFIADYHALTTFHSAKELQNSTLEIAATYLALGLDPDKSLLFKQSDVPEVTELCWILSNVCGMGLLQRAHAYKDKTEKGLPASLGLFSYPVLMAADILLFDTEFVPVGGDQIQHVQMAADIAGSFNTSIAVIFQKPEPKLSSVPKVLGVDGNKMSKSYKNTIPIFATDYKKYTSKIKSDSRDYKTEPLTVFTDITFGLYSLFATEFEIEKLKQDYLHNREFGYGHAKVLLAEKMEQTFGEARSRFENLMKTPNDIVDVLIEGGHKARHIAQKKMQQIREAVGFGLD